MTLDELNSHRLKVWELINARELLEELKTSALHTSRLDGMPRASSTISDRTQNLAVRCAELEDEIDRLQKAVKASKGSIQAFIDTIPDRRTALVFSLRFVDGYEWQQVAEIIGGRNTTEGVKSMCYRFLRGQSGTFGNP